MDRHFNDSRPDPDLTVDATRPSRRKTLRHNLLLTGRLQVGQDEAMVRIRNLSAGGLMAEYPGPVAMDQSVRIEVPGIGGVDGRVAWALAGRVGIAFESPVDPALAEGSSSSK